MLPEEAALFLIQLDQYTHLKLSAANENVASNVIVLELNNKVVDDTESYCLTIDQRKIRISAFSNVGIWNGLNSLLQLIIHQGTNRPIVLEGWHIRDTPLYNWRGFMLDESRHVFGKEEVKKILDQMSLFKLNRLHWHLTDEPAWRLEIKKYPLLTSVGAKGNYTDTIAPVQYYSQQDIREIVSYAAAMHITVVPEVDMPGHAMAANKAYPQYSGGGSPKHPDFTFNPGNEKVYSYLTDILREVRSMFPAGMVHIGGDEVSYGNDKWKTDSLIAVLKAMHHLKTDIDVEHYFIRRMTDSVRMLHQKILGWDEIVPISLPQDSTLIFWWRHDQPRQLQYALENGYDVVLCPRLPLYFDFVQYGRDKVGRRWGSAFNTSQSVYNFSVDSLPVDVSQYQKQILGMQANLWTETVISRERLEYLVFPRLMAMAEAAWSKPAHKDYSAFENRIKNFYPFWKSLDIKYFDVIEPANTPEITDNASRVDYLDKK